MKWEYRAITIMEMSESLTEMLNERGVKGWELVQCDLTKNLFIFKRPAPELNNEERKAALKGYFGGKVG